MGEVSIQWSVDADASTAVYGVDYRADGATLTFMPGESRKCKHSDFSTPVFRLLSLRNINIINL